MAVLDTIYRIFMFIVPYALCFAAYVWVGRKALRVPQKTPRIIACIIIGGGIAFTLYRLIRYIGFALANDLFEYVVIIAMVVVLAVASIVMAIGQPEEEESKSTRQTTSEEKKENGLPS